jgi:hypothetical protein
MRKLKLDPEGLEVESFTARSAPLAARGTVRGCDDTDLDCQPTAIHFVTCERSCWWMCLPSGGDSCDC